VLIVCLEFDHFARFACDVGLDEGRSKLVLAHIFFWPLFDQHIALICITCINLGFLRDFEGVHLFIFVLAYTYVRQTCTLLKLTCLVALLIAILGGANSFSLAKALIFRYFL